MILWPIFGRFKTAITFFSLLFSIVLSRGHTPFLTSSFLCCLLLLLSPLPLFLTFFLHCTSASTSLFSSSLTPSLPLPSHHDRYNLGQVAIGIGDLGLAYQCFKIAI